MRSLHPPRSGAADRKPAARPRQPVAGLRPARSPRQFAGGAGASREGPVPAAPSLAAPAPAADGLPAGLQMAMEAMSGFSLADVVVHRNSAEPSRLGALAFTKGNQIHVAPGQERHLPHEAWHVVQQAQGRVKPTLQMKSGVPVNDDAGLEREADAMGAQASSEAVKCNRAIQGAIVGEPIGRPRPQGAQGSTLPASPFAGARDGKVVQLVKYKDEVGLDEKKFMKLFVNQPQSSDSKLIKEAMILLDRFAERDLGDYPRATLYSWLQEADARDTILKYFGYYLLNKTAPPDDPNLGTLSVPDPSSALGGSVPKIAGRPGLWTEKGPGDTVRRHITAWHNLRQLLNRFMNDFGIAALKTVAQQIRAANIPAISEHSDKADGISKEALLGDKDIIWLALVLNNTPTNLWSGDAVENVSYNTNAYWMKTWVRELRSSQDIAAFRTKIYNSKNHRKAEILNFIDSLDASLSDNDKTDKIDKKCYDDFIFGLEVDAKPGTVAPGVHRKIYDYANNLAAIGKGEMYGIIYDFLRDRDAYRVYYEYLKLDDAARDFGSAVMAKGKAAATEICVIQ